MVRRRAKASEWAKRVEAWRASGDSAEGFSEAHGWNARTLKWWARRVRRSQAGETPAGFVRLIQRRSEGARTQGSAAIEVVLESGRAIRVARGADLELLRAVVDALEAR